MAGQVDLDQLLDTTWRCIENGEIVPDSGIVDQNGGTLQFGPDLGGSCIDCIRICHVAFDVQGND